MKTRNRYATMFLRLVANSQPAEGQNENGCWLWTGATDGKRWPYGLVNKRVDGRHVSVRAHREMEQQLRNGAAQLAADDTAPPWGPLPTVTAPPLDPERETLDHRCYVPLCINPDHWTPVPNAVNAAGRRNPR